MKVPLWLSALLGIPLLAAVGCRDADSGEADGADSADHQGVDGFFDPQKGETWIYKVQREIPFEANLPDAYSALRPERTDSGYLITFERERACTGVSQPAGASKPLTTMEVRENGALLGKELYDLTPRGIFSKGWIAAESPASAEVLERGIALATPTMRPGEIWDGAGRDPSRIFHFRVIERTLVKVPAGEFDATRIQITTDNADSSLKRTIWFAHGVGIIKEETVAYGPERTRVRERSELVHWKSPSDAEPPPAAQAVSAQNASVPAAPDDPAQTVPSSKHLLHLDELEDSPSIEP